MRETDPNLALQPFPVVAHRDDQKHSTPTDGRSSDPLPVSFTR